MDMGAEAGNYKGVMLCNRPMDQPSKPGPALSAPEKPPFRPSGVGGEPAGLNPAKENLISNMNAVKDEAMRRRIEDGPAQGPVSFLSKHRKWLAEMARKKANLNEELKRSAQGAEQKRSRFVAYTREMRQAVRERAMELQEQGLEYAASSAALPQKQQQQQQHYEEEEPEPAPPPKPKPKAAAAPAKPKWAMTEDEADIMDDAEAAELVDFAASLDYDAYIDDLEVRQALNVIRERIDGQKALEAAAAAAEEAASTSGDWRSSFLKEWNGADDDGAGSVRSSRRAPVPAAEATGDEGKPEWDASTRAGEEGAPRANASARAAAEQLRRENPNLAQKHSVSSLARVVERAEMGIEHLPPLRVVTVIENPRVASKGGHVDPSNLPYLHRNPAV